MAKKMPVLFLGHGSPLNAILDNPFTTALKNLAERLPRPEAIMVISAHWQTKGTKVTCQQNPQTIHDFYGFPNALYDLIYPCSGSPRHAELAVSLGQKTLITCDTGWGIDHAAWAVLRHIYPGGEIPVFELSLAENKPAAYHYQLARELAPLRDQGVLCIGSGNIVHNLPLADFHYMDAPSFMWAAEFDQAVKKSLLKGQHEKLIHYESLTSSSALAVPTNEHYLPLLYALAMQAPGDSVNFIYEGFQNATISMRSLLIGEPVVAVAA